MATETFSRHLVRMARRSAGLTQAQLAQKARTSQAAISEYESGKRSPSVDSLSRIMQAAGFELRMRLAEPDTHDSSRKYVESLLSRDQLKAVNRREARRVARATSKR